MSDISKKIKIFKKANPQVDPQSIEQLVKDVAYDCLEHLVKNEEFNGRAAGAWWTICESFDLQINDEKQMLPLERSPDTWDLQQAIGEGDIKAIKKILKNNVHINFGNETNALKEAIVQDKLEVLKFFIEDDFIHRNPMYNCQIRFDIYKGELFWTAFNYERREILSYLINTHDIEHTQEAKKILLEKDTDFRNEVVNMIENKYMDFLLEMKKPNLVKKPKNV